MINNPTTQPSPSSHATDDIDEDQRPDVGSLDWLAQHDQNSLDNGTDSEGQSSDAPNPDVVAEPLNFIPVIEDIKTSLDFINLLKNASLDNQIHHKFDDDSLYNLQNPPQEQLFIDDPDVRLSLDIFMATTNASQESYNAIRQAILRRYPNSSILTFYKIKNLLDKITGVIPILHDMCKNSCVGFTGAFASLMSCPICGELRYESSSGNTQTPVKQFTTLPIGPQLQALWRSPESAERMQYRNDHTNKIIEEIYNNQGTRPDRPFCDLFDGTDYLQAVIDNKIQAGDMVLVMSVDGAQLYENKASDCWIYIWIIMDYSPDVRYKKRHVLPGGFIPGPNKPKNMDSFVFPGLYHLSAIQNTGLQIWDSRKNQIFTSYPFFALLTADGPGMACLNGFVGHQGRMHCRLYCPIIGRHKSGAPQYYPARLKPNNYSVQGCDHADVDLNTLLNNFTSEAAAAQYGRNLKFLAESSGITEYKRRRLETGLCKPTILSGISQKHILGIPTCFPLDIMHLPALNLPDLFISLWRGKLDCEKTDDRATWDWAILKDAKIWKEHGKAVADCTPYIPGSFDRPPRNPAEKISSGYKAWEYLLYFYGLGPCLFYGILPKKYWKNYCKLIGAVYILMQEEISLKELQQVNHQLIDFSNEYEELYYQRRADRLHFVRPSIHTISHFPHETERVGPGIVYSQWTIERSIGSFGEEIRQHSNPFANLAQRGVYRAQINALKAMIPDIEPIEKPLPMYSKDLGHGYVLLPAMDTAERDVRECEERAICFFLSKAENGTTINLSWKPRIVNGHVSDCQMGKLLDHIGRKV